MTDVNASDKDTVSTLVLLGENEYVLRASPGRVVFDNYSGDEASSEQAITLTLERERESYSGRSLSSTSAAVPIILSTPSTPRFELHQVSSHDVVPSSSPLECLLSPSSPRTYMVKFRPPAVSESDFVWDDFQDQLVIHTRLSKLVVYLEAWKYAVPAALSHDHGNNLLFPSSLPDVKAPPLKRFGAIERNGGQCQSPTKHTEPVKSASTTMLDDSNSLDASPKPRTPCAETLRPLSSSRESLDESSLVNAGQPPLPVVTAVQSQREAEEVILKLRRRRTARSNAKEPVGVSPTSVTDRQLFPETVALDAHTKAELEDFNNLVAAASDHVTRQAAKAKSELAYYQHLQLPTPPRDTAALKPRNPRQMSAVPKRPSKLPSLLRPSSGEATTPNTSMNNQEKSLPDQEAVRRVSRQRIVKTTKLQSLPVKKAKKLGKLQITNQQHGSESELSDFDESDPEVDEAPVMPDDLSGVATLDAYDPNLSF